MRLTIDAISQILKVPTSSIIQALAELGIEPDVNKLLSDKDIKKLRPVLFRYYQHNRITTSGESAESAAGSLETSSDESDNSELSGTDEFMPDEPSVEEFSHSDEELGFSEKNDNSSSATDIPKSVDDFLEQLIIDHVLMIDTCSLMHDGCDLFIDSICPLLKKHKKKIIIPQKVIEELRKHQNGRNDSLKVALAEKGLQLCQKLRDENCLSIRGGQYDNFADNVFFVHFSNLRFRYNMVLITQDYKLSKDILQLNTMQTGGGNPVRVFKLSSKGFLIEIVE